MSNPIAPNVPTLAALPAVLNNQSYLVTNQAGITFDSREPRWPTSERESVDVGALRRLFGEDLLEGLNGTFRDVAQRSGGYKSLAVALRHYHRTMHPNGLIERWAASDLHNYRAKLVAELGNERHLIHLRPFLKTWKALRYPGVPDDVPLCQTCCRVRFFNG